MNSPKSLKKIFIFYITIAIVIVNSAVLIIFGIKNYEKDKIRLKQDIAQISNSLYPVFENYLWLVDYKSLKHFSNTIIKTNPYICSLIILDEKNQTIVKLNKRIDYCLEKKLFKFEKKIFFKNFYLGKVYISFSKRLLYEHQKKFLLLTSFITIFLSIILVLLIIIVFQKIIDKPVLEIIKYFSDIKKNNYFVHLKKTNLKEFDNIIDSLDSLTKELMNREKRNIELTNRLNKVLNSVPVGIIISDNKGRYLEINETFCRFLKMPKQEVLSKNIEAISAPGYTMEKAYEFLQEVFNIGKTTYEWKLKDKQGNIIDLFVLGEKITIDNKEAALFAATDVTYLKKLEKEVIKKEKLEALGLLAGGIAHDFNNILTSIFGGIELIQIFLEKGDISKAQKRLNILLKSIDRAKFLTNQLLTFAKGGALVRQHFSNIHNLIKDVTDFILSGSEILVVYNFEKNLKPLELDPDQFSLVIQNIILNAKEALHNKGKIIISTKDAGNFAEISIKDFGPGISKNSLDKIWEPFFTDKSEGSGLGLSIVYSIIKKHNGEIKVFSEKDKFTEFKIYIPFSKENLLDKRDILKVNFHIPKKNLNILVLEDEKDVQDILKEMLSLLNHKVEFSKTGEEAIEKYKNNKFDLVILDLTIKGGMGGLECFEILKKIDKNIKGIVYSGYSDDPILEKYKEFGFCYAIKKPFKISTLKEGIEKCIGGING